MNPISYAPEVIADSSGKFVGNALRFATHAEAEANVNNLAMRWTLVREVRVVESPDPVNYAWIDGRLVGVPVVATVALKRKRKLHVVGASPAGKHGSTE